MVRLFIAAWPSPDVRERLQRLPRPERVGVRWVPHENWHITLRFLGEVVAREVEVALAEVALPRATARLGPHTERLDARQIVVPVDGVDELARIVYEATAHIGQPDRRGFRGHLTVARTRPGEGNDLDGSEIDGTFDVDEVSLVASDLRPDGAVYRTVAAIPTT